MLYPIKAEIGSAKRSGSRDAPGGIGHSLEIDEEMAGNIISKGAHNHAHPRRERHNQAHAKRLHWRSQTHSVPSPAHIWPSDWKQIEVCDDSCDASRNGVCDDGRRGGGSVSELMLISYRWDAIDNDAIVRCATAWIFSFSSSFVEPSRQRNAAVETRVAKTRPKSWANAHYFPSSWSIIIYTYYHLVPCEGRQQSSCLHRRRCCAIWEQIVMTADPGPSRYARGNQRRISTSQLRL